MAKKSSRKPRKDPGAWRIDGISPEAVAAAERAAAQMGVTLEVWLGRLVRDIAQREREAREKRRGRPAQD